MSWQERAGASFSQRSKEYKIPYRSADASGFASSRRRRRIVKVYEGRKGA